MSDPLSTPAGPLPSAEPAPRAKRKRARIARRMRHARRGNSLFWTIVWALLIAVAVRTLIFQPFNIPSDSMRPALETGDYVVASKWPYGYSKFSIPFSPALFEGRVLEHLPERGDVVVFRGPNAGSQTYIKRVLALPGDQVAIREGVVVLNGEPVPRGLVGEDQRMLPNGRLARYRVYEEILPGGVAYEVLDRGLGELDELVTIRVPEGHVFVLGDNRDESRDSRVSPPLGPGFVPLDHIVGRAEIVLVSARPEFELSKPWTWWMLRRDRVFQSLDPDPA